MRAQPLISVQDIASSRSWYEEILGLRSAHGGDEYERMMSGGELVLQLHRWDAHEHPHLSRPTESSSRGVVLWFQTDEFDDTVSKVLAQHATILEGPQTNSNANHREIWLRDPDGFTVVIAGKPGDV